MFVPPPFTWTGFYVGVNAGAAWSMGNRQTTLSVPTFTNNFLVASWPGNLGNSNTGFIGGGQAGYNWQMGAFVVGVETHFYGDDPEQDLQLYQLALFGHHAFPGRRLVCER